MSAEIAAFFVNNHAQLVMILNDEKWVYKLTYLAYMLSKFNECIYHFKKRL